MTDFGTCWSCPTGLTFPAVMVTGNRVVAEAIVRRWMTDLSTLIDDANYGYNLQQFLNGDLNVSDLPRVAQQAAAEAEKDERVHSCSVTVTFASETLTVSGVVTTATGTFPLVVSISQLTVALLQPTA